MLLVLVIFFSGCSSDKLSSPPIPDLNFEGNISITYNDYNLKCSIKNSLSTGCEIVVNEPEILRGFSFLVIDGVCTVKFDDLTFEFDSNVNKNELANSVAESLTNILTTTNYEKTGDNNWKYIGTTSFGKFILVQDGVSGYPLSLSIPQINIEVIFENLKSIDS